MGENQRLHNALISATQDQQGSERWRSESGEEGELLNEASTDTPAASPSAASPSAASSLAPLSTANKFKRIRVERYENESN